MFVLFCVFIFLFCFGFRSRNRIVVDCLIWFDLILFRLWDGMVKWSICFQLFFRLRLRIKILECFFRFVTRMRVRESPQSIWIDWFFDFLSIIDCVLLFLHFCSYIFSNYFDSCFFFCFGGWNHFGFGFRFCFSVGTTT